MNKPHPSFSINECKVKASILLKSLQSNEQDKAKASAKRFKRLPVFSEMSIEEIISATVIKHKHALAVIALEKGFSSWAELKCQLPFVRGGFLNSWFADYTTAKTKLDAEGGFLLPYQKQYFICSEDYIKNLGLDPDDPDWKLIEFDWAKPVNKKAWRRLYKKWMRIQECQNG